MMKGAFLLAVLVSLAFDPSCAQTPVPDPTPAYSYAPLSVGDVWEYENEFIDAVEPGIGRYTRREIVRDSLYSGRRYAVEVTSQLDHDGQGWTRARTRVVRFDTASARVMRLDEGGRESMASCPFDAPFDALVNCYGPVEEFPDGDTHVGGRADAELMLARGGGRIQVDAVKQFAHVLADYGTYALYAAPLGYVGETPGMCTFCSRTLIYARVLRDDGSVVEVGARFPVDEESGPGASRLTLRLAPNPTADAVHVSLGSVRGPATVEVFDALGRWMARTETAAPRLMLDTRDWAPGLYLVRATSGGETATASVVRR